MIEECTFPLGNLICHRGHLGEQNYGFYAFRLFANVEEEGRFGWLILTKDVGLVGYWYYQDPSFSRMTPMHGKREEI